MFSWGRATTGQLGQGGIEESSVLTPRYMRHLGKRAYEVVDVACGWEHTVVAMKDGGVHACGSNDFGQLGLESGRSRLGEFQCPSHRAWVAVYFFGQITQTRWTYFSKGKNLLETTSVLAFQALFHCVKSCMPL